MDIDSLLTCSPPLSDLGILILSLEAFSIKAFNSEKFSHTSDLFFRKKTHVYLEKSSIKVRRYLDPFMDVMGIGPLISECISPNMLVAQFSFPRSNLYSGASNHMMAEKDSFSSLENGKSIP